MQFYIDDLTFNNMASAFLARLCSGVFIGDKIDTRRSNAITWHLKGRKAVNEDVNIVPFSNEDYHRIASIHLNSEQRPFIIITKDLTSIEPKNDTIEDSLKRINVLAQQNNCPVSVILVGSKSDKLTPEETKQKKAELNTLREAFNAQNPNSKVMIEGSFVASSKTGAGIEQIREAMLIAKISETINQLYAQKKPKIIAGLDKIQRITDSKAITIDEKINQIIDVAKYKKADTDFTRFFHQKVRGRDEKTEECYQILSKLAEPLTEEQLTGVLFDLEALVTATPKHETKLGN